MPRFHQAPEELQIDLRGKKMAKASVTLGLVGEVWSPSYVTRQEVITYY